MKIAVRYHSRFGHSRLMAEQIKDLVGVEPASVETPLAEPVDLLILGAGVFLGKVDSKVEAFVKTLTPELVKEVVCFGSSAIIKSPVPQMRAMLERQGIKVSQSEFSCRGAMGPVHGGHPNDEDINNFRNFVKDYIKGK